MPALQVLAPEQKGPLKHQLRFLFQLLQFVLAAALTTLVLHRQSKLLELAAEVVQGNRKQLVHLRSSFTSFFQILGVDA
ncbi:hypothetical protein DQ04_12511010 [Trypanosoma grayi]|uniref:hypothetical protein n=1 Tax=Trypanosoma grayi TaxID=71804 RepID=UPI0004F46437|nr:hypothetical protein DQ04_12511010 [Trypanosoma grayi]KEG06738.1 hypothetical protein DQ04_12511010 [Trypanosoma grayi]